MNPLDFIEDATALFRSAFTRDAWLYYLGAAPFVAAAVWVGSRLAGLAASADQIAGWALLLTLLYAIKTLTDGAFLRRLLGTALPGGFAADAGWLAALDRSAQELAARGFLIGLWLVCLPLGIGLVPLFLAAQFFPLVISDLGADPGADLAAGPRLRHDLRHRLRRALVMPWQTYGVYLLVALTAAAAAVILAADIAVAAWFVPTLAQSFTGFEDAFFRALPFIGNSTLLAGVGGLLYLLFDPWFKAVAALAYFRSVSAATGADLAAQLAQLEAAEVNSAARALAAVGGREA